MPLVLLICFDDHGGHIGDVASSPDAECSGLPPMPLDAASERVFVTYHPGGCRLSMLLCLPMAYKTNVLAYLLHRKPIVVFPIERKRVTRKILTNNVQYSM